MEKFDDRVDAYIAKAADFAKPVLTHLREVVHRASPDISETMKWSSPFFDLEGPVCQMAAFKQHCSFGFWKASLLDDPENILSNEQEAAGNFGRITSIADLPAEEVLIAYIHRAITLNLDGTKKSVTKVKPAAGGIEMEVPPYLTDLLKADPQAKANFEKFSPSQRKEYIVWFEEAKTETTRAKRVSEGMEWIREGKSRHWKYK
jgi:uncharacterized protein YdeI (YjbR/CyaY-like superfamily)